MNPIYDQNDLFEYLRWNGRELDGKWMLVILANPHHRCPALDEIYSNFIYLDHRTEDVVFFLPGYANMMNDYFSRKDRIKLVVMIVDSRIGLTQDDLDMKEYLDDLNIKYLIVANKIDKLSNNQLNNNKRTFFNDFNNILYISAEKKTNINHLEEFINKVL